MSYRYNQANTDSDTPTYKGKPLKLVGSYAAPAPGEKYGQNLWVLEGHGVVVSAHSKRNGWEVSIKMDDRHTLPGTTHGSDLEKVIDTVIANELSAIKGAEMRLESAKKSLTSLGK
jgi:hypothetical protein